MRGERGRLEGAVIDALATGAAMTVAQVREALGGRLAHTTVMTALGRLCDKGVVTRTRRGRSYVYALAAPVDELPALQAAVRMRRELENHQARAQVLANFVAGLGPDDEALLLELLADSDEGAEGPGPQS